MSRLGEGAAGDYPVYDNAPLYMRLSLLFPYASGMLFQNAICERDGQEGFAEVFRRAPVSTQQIIHPEDYFSNVTPTQPELPDAHLPRGYKGLVGGELGEFEHAVLLEQFLEGGRPRRSRRTGAAAISSCARTERPAAWCCCTPANGTAKKAAAVILPPTARCSKRSGRRCRWLPKAPIP